MSTSHPCLWPLAGVARFAQKYPAVLDALLRTMLEMVCKYHKTGESRASWAVLERRHSARACRGGQASMCTQWSGLMALRL